VASLGREILYLTERAMFRLRDGQLTLTEIAPGLDLQRDVLDALGALVAVADDLALMDAGSFTTGRWELLNAPRPAEAGRPPWGSSRQATLT